jgi:hypothetical protein
VGPKKKKMGPKVSKAVRAMRLYLGSIDFASVKDQQRLFNRAKRAAEQVAAETGVLDAFDQIKAEATRQGKIRPLPGQHI